MEIQVRTWDEVTVDLNLWNALVEEEDRKIRPAPTGDKNKQPRNGLRHRLRPLATKIPIESREKMGRLGWIKHHKWGASAEGEGGRRRK